MLLLYAIEKRLSAFLDSSKWASDFETNQHNEAEFIVNNSEFIICRLVNTVRKDFALVSMSNSEFHLFFLISSEQRFFVYGHESTDGFVCSSSVTYK